MKHVTQEVSEYTTEWMDKHPEAMKRVIFNVFKDEDKGYYEEQLC